MTPIRKTFTFRIDDDVREGLQQIWARDGITVAEQVRRALRLWLDSKGVQKTERKRAVTRKRP